MTDMYTEKIVRRAPSSKIIAIKAVIATVTMFLAYIVFYILCSSMQLIGFMPAAVALILFVGWKAFSFFNTEYEYTVTNGSLDIDKIVAKKSRKRLLAFPAKSIEIVAPFTKEYMAKYEEGNFKTTVDARSSEKSECWFLVGQTNNGERARVLFEPSERMIYIFEKNIPLRMPYKPELADKFEI